MTSIQVEQFLQQLNDAWLNRDYAQLAGFYHSDVVLLPPDAGAPLEGKDAIIATYKEFHAACEVDRFSVTEQSNWSFAAPDQDTEATTTVVHMRFAIDYRFTAGGSEANETPLQSEEGMEVYTLLQTARRSAPEIIWRAQFTL